MNPSRPRAGLTSAPVPALALAVLLAGCTTSYVRPVSQTIWRRQVQAYVAAAHGDMQALRDVEVMPGQPGFRVYSHDRPEESKDIAGVLVGVASWGEASWYVYLVAEIDRETVSSMRAAAASPRAGTLDWRIGGDDLGGAEAYRAHRLGQWQARHGGPGEALPPRAVLGFPGSGNRFGWSLDGPILTVREEASGATWFVDLQVAPPPAPAARPPRGAAE